MEDKTFTILEKYLDSGFRVSPMSPNKTTIDDIAEVERELQINFPNEYIAHLLGEGAEILGERGLYIEVKEDIWARPKLYDIAPFWSMCYGIHTYTASQESEDWMRLVIVGKEFMKSNELKAVPILKIIGDADVYCVNENKEIVRYNHELNKLEKTNMNFWEVFELELKELRNRKDRKIIEKNK